MADQKITELPIKGTSAINLADYLLGIDSADGYQMLISDLAKKIIEAYNGSSLGGSARTLKSALDTIATNSGSNLATIETSTTASKAYAVGDYLVMNGILYKVTAAIASGGTITVDTNVTVAAAGDDIAAIATKIGNTSMGTTATTITGAIAEHEADISGLNSNTTATSITDIETFANNLPTGAFRPFRLGVDEYTGTDLDDLNQYYKAGVGFIIKRNSGSIRVVLFNGAAGAYPAIMKLKNSSGWQPWQKLDGTNV